MANHFARIVNEEIENLKISNFYIFGSNFAAKPLQPLQRYFPAWGDAIEFEAYYFHLTVKTPWNIVSSWSQVVGFPHDGNPLFLKGSRTWTTLEDLGQKFVNMPQFLDSQGYDTLVRWHRHRHENDPDVRSVFMELPPELRDIIYEYCFMNTDAYVFVRRLGLCTTCHQKHCSLSGNAYATELVWHNGWVPPGPWPYMEGTHDLADEVHMLWGGVSKAINIEIARERDRRRIKIWNEARRSFINPVHFLDVSWRLAPSRLTHIGLNFSNEKYFELFDFARLPQNHRSNPLTMLKSFQHLKQLDIKFRSPRWSFFKNYWTKPPSPDTSPTRGARVCQKIVTEMILTHALLEVRNIQRVSVEGYIKTSTKMNFDAALRELKENEQQTAPHWQTWNMTKSYASVLAAHAKAPICHCSTPCWAGDWNVLYECRKSFIWWDPFADKMTQMARLPTDYYPRDMWDPND